MIIQNHPEVQEQINRLNKLVDELSEETSYQEQLTSMMIYTSNKDIIKECKSFIKLSNERKKDISKKIDACRSILSWYKAELLNS